MALGSRLQNIVVERWADAEDAIDALKRGGQGRNARPVASVVTKTISEFTTLRQEMTAAERVPAGV